jgi:DNA-binding beta-propeller fold protein YncE
MTRARRQQFVSWLAAVTSAAVAGCGLNQQGVLPPEDTIAFPASAVTDKSGEWMFITNSNADLRYNDGTLLALRLGRAAADRARGGVTDADGSLVEAAAVCPRVNYVHPLGESPDFCCIDPLDPYILMCDERRYVESGATVRIGSFAAGMLRQDPTCGIRAADMKCAGGCTPDAVGGDVPSRLLIAVRGDTSLTYIDVMPEEKDAYGNVTAPLMLDCVGGADRDNGEPFAPCDENHRVVETEAALALTTPDTDPPPVRFPDEPYALAIDEVNGLLYVGHLAGATNRPFSGGVSLFDVAAVDGSMPAPRFIAPFNIFAPNTTGQVGVTSVRWEPRRGVFATSRYLPLVSGLATTNALGCPHRSDGAPIREIAVFGNGDNFGTTLNGTETRGIELVDQHAFVLQRVPPTVVSFYEGTANQFIEVCQSPTFLHKHPRPDPMEDPEPASLDTRLFVTCSDGGEVYVINPFIPKVERIFNVGRAPAGLVFPPNDPTVAYVVGFGDNNISVVDIEPGSPTQYHVVQRIGFPNTVPR